MRVYELYEVSSKPRKNDTHYYENRIYSNSLYMEAECEVECNLEEEEISDEVINNEVEKVGNVENNEVLGNNESTEVSTEEVSE